MTQDYTSYIQVDQGWIILAASEVLLAFLGKPRKGTKALIEDWLVGAKQKKLRKSKQATSLIPYSIGALERVLGEKSELAELMSERTGKPDPDWLKGVLDLKQRLTTIQ